MLIDIGAKRGTKEGSSVTETMGRKASPEGWNEPTKNLLPLESREMPEPLPLRRFCSLAHYLFSSPGRSSRSESARWATAKAEFAGGTPQ